MNRTFTPIVTDDAIRTRLQEEFQLPVVYRRPENNRLEEGTNFFMYRPTRIGNLENQKFLYQELVIALVILRPDEMLEFSVMQALQDLGLYIAEIVYEEETLTDAFNYAEVIYFVCMRKIVDSVPSRGVREA